MSGRNDFTRSQFEHDPETGVVVERWIRNEEFRMIQAKVLWEAGWGRELGCETFEEYLNGSKEKGLEPIPQIPEWSKDYPDYLNHTVLVDARIDLATSCRLLKVIRSYADFVPHDPDRAKSGVYWMRCQDGCSRFEAKTAIAFREELGTNEVGLSAIEGLALFAQAGTRYLELPGSVDCSESYYFAILLLSFGRMVLGTTTEHLACGDYGPASRGD